MVGSESVKKREDRMIIYCLYFVGFMDLLSVSIVIPSITRHARNLGASPAMVGIIGSIYGGVQLVSSPVMGKASDVAGRKRMLLLSLFGAAVGYLLLGHSNSLLLLALFRIPLGILKHSQSIAKTYLADVTSPLERPEVFGTFNAASSLGFVVGPIIGGHVSMLDNGFFKVATLAAVGMALNCAFVFLFVEDERQSGDEEHDPNIASSSRNRVISEESDTDKNEAFDITENKRSVQSFDGLIYKGNEFNRETLRNKNRVQREQESDKTKGSTPNAWTSKLVMLVKVASVSSVIDLLLIRFIMGLAMMIFRSNFSAMLEFRYNTTPKSNGYIISYNGLVSGFSGILVGKISKLYKSDAKMLLHFSVLLAMSMLCITFSPDIWVLVLFITPLAISSAVSRVCVTNITFRQGKEDEKGVLLGLGNSLLSFGRMLSPLIGGLAQEYSIYGSGLAAVVTAVVGISVQLISPQDKDHKKKIID